MTRNSSVVRLLPLLFFGLPAACAQQSPAAKSNLRPEAARSDIDEVHSLVQAVKENPSVKDPSQAGPPIHVDSNPKSAGMHQAASAPMNKMSR